MGTNAIKPLIAGNWKMNRLPSESVSWLQGLLNELDALPQQADRSELLLCVPFTHLPGMAEAAFGWPVSLGAQDVSAHEAGAYTGEVAAAMLADLGVRYVIVGHSERRQYHAEDDATVAAKARQALAHGLTPIVCVGENREERDAGRATEVVLAQLAGSLAGVKPPTADALVVAYEPVWAIGTGLTATAEDAQEMSHAIRQALKSHLPEHASSVRVLYGGSMKPGNAAELLAKPDVNGGLIGGASLEVADLLAIESATAAA
ncbi:MAG: triose-phosphate isomerase [Trueperaceae bacterium]